MIVLAALALFVADVREIAIPKDRNATIRVACPARRTTRIVFPEAMTRLTAPASETLGFAVAEASPRAIVTVQPSAAPGEWTLEFHGPTLDLRLVLQAVASGGDSEVHLLETPLEPVATPAATPTPTSAPPTAPPTIVPSTAPATPAPVFDLEGVLRARPVAIDRHEGLPGQRAMVLVDALQGEKWIWLRFTLEGGAAARVAHVSSEAGEITAFVQEPSGKDLRLIVQLSHAAAGKGRHLFIETDAGPSYSFSLTSGVLGKVLREMAGS
jgi:hypothetical protein